MGNPLEEKETAEGTYRDNVAKKLPKLKKLDGICIILLFIEYIKNAQFFFFSYMCIIYLYCCDHFEVLCIPYPWKILF